MTRMKNDSVVLKHTLFFWAVPLMVVMTISSLSCYRRPAVQYAIELENKLDKNIDKVRLVYDDDSFDRTFGVVVPDGVASYENAHAPLPNKATLTWISSDQQQHRVKLELPTVVNSKLQENTGFGRIRIEIMKNQRIRVTQSHDVDPTFWTAE